MINSDPNPHGRSRRIAVLALATILVALAPPGCGSPGPPGLADDVDLSKYRALESTGAKEEDVSVQRGKGEGTDGGGGESEEGY